jgi:hypothetical protein
MKKDLSENIEYSLEKYKAFTTQDNSININPKKRGFVSPRT